MIHLLREQEQKSKERLLNLIEYLYYINTKLIPQTKNKYIKYFGQLEIELEKLTRKNSLIEKSFELLYYSAIKGKPMDKISKKSILSYSLNRNSLIKINDKVKDATICNRFTNNMIRKMYYNLAKQLHPDTSESTELFERFWNIIIMAYKVKDHFIISQLYYSLCFDRNRFYKNLEHEKEMLAKRIIKLEKGIKETKNRINALFRKDPLIYSRKLNNPNWIKNRRKMIFNKILILRRKIKLREKYINISDFASDYVV